MRSLARFFTENGKLAVCARTERDAIDCGLTVRAENGMARIREAPVRRRKRDSEALHVFTRFCEIVGFLLVP